MSLAGLYHRMEDGIPTQGFRNKLRFALSGSTMAVRCNKKRSKQLSIEWIDARSFKVNWSPWNSSWGEGILRQYSLDGVEGLLEDGKDGITFWEKYE